MILIRNFFCLLFVFLVFGINTEIFSQTIFANEGFEYTSNDIPPNWSETGFSNDGIWECR